MAKGVLQAGKAKSTKPLPVAWTRPVRDRSSSFYGHIGRQPNFDGACLDPERRGSRAQRLRTPGAGGTIGA